MKETIRLSCVVPLFASAFTFAAGETALDAAGPLTIEPDSAAVCADGSAIFKAKKDGKDIAVSWTLAPDLGNVDATTGDHTKYTPPPGATSTTATTGTVKLTATVSGAPAETATAQITLVGICKGRYGGEVVRATLGFEQVGAAGTTSDQKYSFDFFISRPLPVPGRGDNEPTPNDEEFYLGPRWRWWGDVRVASYPQQINSELASFTKDFAATAGKVQVNELVQSLEFVTGPEFRIGSFPHARDTVTEEVRVRYALTAYFGLGSIGPFPPGNDPAVFAVPDAPAANAAASPQYTAFHARYPDVTSTYVAFAPESPHLFSKQWHAGVRLYSYYADTTATSQPLTRAPASVEIGFGRNALVSADNKTTWHASAYYPLALSDRSKPDALIIYLFGDVDMRFSPRSDTQASLFLKPAVDANNTAIPLTNQDVAIVPVQPNDRDTYRAGVSIDLIRVWNKLSTSSAPSK